MNRIAERIREYRSSTKPTIFFVWKTRIFWLTAILLLMIFCALLIDMYHRVFLKSDLYWALPLVAIICEISLAPAMLQMHFQGAQIRYQLLHPGAVTVGFRVPSAKIRQDKVNYINKLFMPQGSFRDLARDLESEWEWQKNIFYQAEEKVVRSSARFFLLPEGSNLATYMAGFLAISAALIITLVDRDVFYQELTSVASQAWSNIIILHLVIVFPLAAMIIPLAIMVVMVKNFGIWARQCVDDSYLDQVGFYKFICELVQLEENMQRRTLMRTTGFVYWFVRIGTVPLSQVRKHFHNARRSLRLAKRRRIKDLKKI